MRHRHRQNSSALKWEAVSAVFMFLSIKEAGRGVSFEPSQPLGIISRLKETFIKRHIGLVERTNKVEIRPEEQSEKTESCWENLWNEIQLKGR